MKNNAPLAMRLDAVENRIASASIETRTRQENIEKRLDDTRAELAGLDAVEHNAILKGTEKELDDILNKKAILANRVHLLEMEQSAERLPDADKQGGEILKELRDLDNISEEQTKRALQPLFRQIETILHARADERRKIAALKERSINVYKLNNDTQNRYLLPVAITVDCLTLGQMLDTNQAFGRVKNGI